MDVKTRYMDYLRVALFGSYLLRREDIREVMENFDRISEEPLFKMARMRASDDCQGLGDMISDPKAMENGADDFAQPTPLDEVRQDRY